MKLNSTGSDCIVSDITVAVVDVSYSRRPEVLSDADFELDVVVFVVSELKLQHCDFVENNVVQTV